MEHIELKLKLIRDLKSQTMIVPRGTSKSLVTIPVVDFLNTVNIRGSLGTENHVIVKVGLEVIAHCKIAGNIASVVREGWDGRSHTLLQMLREVGYV